MTKSWDKFFKVLFSLGALALLIVSIIVLLRGVNNAVDDSRAKQVPVITHTGFELPSGQWTVPTRYAAAFPGGRRSVPTDPVFSDRLSNPKFTLFATSPQLMMGPVQWFRSVPPYDTWEPHSMQQRALGQYTDTNNIATTLPVQ